MLIYMKGSEFMQNTVIERPTLTVPEAAKLIGISVPKMYEVTEMSSFNALIRIGKRKLILRTKLTEWLESQALKEQHRK